MTTTARGETRRRRSVATGVALLAVGMSFTFLSLPALGETVDSNGSLAVRQVTVGAAGGPFVFELTDGAAVPLVRHGVSTTGAEGEAVDVAGLGDDLAAGTYTVRQDLGQLPAEPAGGHWEFTGVECDGAPVTVDASTGSATLILDPGASATCTVADTWVADEAAVTEAAPAPGAASAEIAPAATDDVVLQQVPTALNAVITVKKAGNRTGSTTTAPLAGAQFGVYPTETDAINNTNRLANCTTVANGQCAMDVPGIGTRDVFVREFGTPPGYFRLDTISTGTSSTTGDNTTPKPYIERINIQNNNSYTVPVNQPLSPSGSAARSFANGLINPQLTPACGLDLGMVFDVSSSINATEMTQMKNAAMTFVSDLTGTPSQIAMFSFGTVAPGAGAPANLPLTQVATGNAPVINYINGLPPNPSSGSNRTNWDAGLFQVAQSASPLDVVLMLTDGNPTVWGPTGVGPALVGSSAQVVPAGIEASVASANAVKALGSHMIAIGIGTNLPVDNLQAISGPNDAFTTGFDQLADLLRALATAACKGTVTVVKEAQPNGQTGFTPAGGWTFNTSTPGVSPASGTTAVSTGAVNFSVDFSTSSLPKQVTFDEVLKPGWSLVQQGGLNASCTTQGLTAPRDALIAGPTGFTVTVGPNDIVSCLVRNQQLPLPRLTLVKQVTNNNGGTAVATAWTLNAAGPTTLTGPTGSTAVTNVVVPAGTYNLSESGGPLGYSAGPWSCTGATSSTASSVTLGATDVATCTIVNDDQPAHLTLVKTVTNHFGSALPTDWTLNATGPTPISGVTGSAAVTNAAVNAGNYNVFESNGPPGYVSGAWSCATSLRSAFRTAQALTLGIGESATCTLNNEDASAQLTLVKQVINNNGGTAPATAWTLGADGPEILSGATGTAAVTAVQVPIGTYALSETDGPAGYAASSWSCTGATQSTGTTVTLAIGQSATCSIVNDDIAAHLTLSKAVINDNGGTALPTDWTLNAAGPTTGISGATGTAPVTGVQVLPGTYALSESAPGPPGYAASPWACTGAAVSDGTSVTPALGENVFSAIVNDDQPALLTLVKQVTNDNGGTALATDWTLSATGVSSGISGTTGSASVTNVGVPPGTYALAETGPGGYLASAWSCVGGTQTGASIAVALGQSATCTITNNDIAPQLTLQKTVINDNGGTAVDTDWTLTATGPTPDVTGVEGDAAITNAPVLVGVYTLSESGPDGYAPSGWVCTGAAVSDTTSVTLAPGELATCTITNDDTAATLTLVKQVVNDDGGTAVATDWTLTATGPTAGVSGPSGDPAVTGVPVSAGAYVLSESTIPGYAASAWSCVGGTLSGSTVTLALAESATCTIVNDDVPATLTLVKQVVNDDGGTAAATDWTLTATGPTAGVSGPSGDPLVTAVPVSAGSYVLSESIVPGYAASAWSCVGGTVSGSTLTLALAESATCTITNDDVPATLTLVKQVVNDNGGTAAATDWTLTATGPTAGVSGPSGDPLVTAVPVSAGAYVLSESTIPGYAASAWSCVGGTLAGSTVTLALAESATCTIVNDDVPATLTLVKQVVNDDGGTAAATDWTLTATGPTTGVTGPTGDPAVTAVPVSAGAYVLSESTIPGYAASAWSCVGGTVSGSTVTLALAESATCTIVNDDIPATLTLVKQVVNDDGGTAAPTDWTLDADGPTTGVSGPTGDPAVTAVPVSAAAYVLSESGPDGYAASAWSCVGGSLAGATVTLALGESATCTIVNDDAPASLTLVKQVVNDDGGTALPTEWTLTATGPTPISGPTGDPLVTAAAVEAGTYVLSELGPMGYAASAWSCVGGTQTGSSVALALGESATCTITNDDVPATLTLVKQVVNDNGGTAVPTDWTLTADGPTPDVSGPSGDPLVTAVPVSAGAYVLSESTIPGYAASAWSCVGGALSGSTVTLALAESATCTIVNDDVPATLTLVKQVVNDDGGTAAATDWTLTATGPTAGVSGPTGDPAVTAVPVSAGAYVLSESTIPGYAASAWSCVGGALAGATVTLALGESATCTITNDDIPATLTLVKQVVNDDGGTAAATDWTLTATGPTTGVTGPTGDPAVTAVPVSAGAYVLSESTIPGYAASAWSCVGGALAGSTVTLASGESATCTITNDDIPATLTLVKQVVNDHGGTAAATDWTLTAAGPTPDVSGPTGDPAVTAVPVSAGSYDLSESGPVGYSASAWSCAGGTQTGSSVALALGESATCTIVNDDIPASLTLVKQVVNDNGGTAAATDWTLTATGPTAGVTGPTGDSAVTGAPVSAGAYDLSESGPAGYAASAWSCEGGTQTDDDSIELALGESATCTITNDDIPALLTLVKEVVNDHGGTAVPTDWTLTASSPAQTISGATGDPEVTNAEVLPGTYEVTESGPAEYVASTFSCVGGVQNGPTITLALGESATCTVSNDDIEAEITLEKTSSATMITPGSQVPYAFTVTNVSDATAQNVIVTDPLPEGLTFVSSPDGCTAADPRTVTCTIGTLPPGAVATRNILTLAANPFPSASVDADGLVPNTASVTAPDTNCPPAGRAIRTTPEAVGVLQATEEDCESTHPLPVLPTVAITKTSVSASFSPGGLVPYVITVMNTGPVVARNVVVTDDLPVGLSFVSAVPACTASGQLVTCPVGDVGPGTAVTIDLVTRAADPFPIESLVNGEIVNVALVGGTGTNCDNGSSDPVCTDSWPVRADGAVVAGAEDENQNPNQSLPFTGAAILWLLVTAAGAIAAGVFLLCVPSVPAGRRRAWFVRMKDELRSRLDPTS